MFCDFESDTEVLSDYMNRWIHALSQLAKVEVPPEAELRHLLYLSADKSDVRNKLDDFLSALSDEIRWRFVVVEYVHPAEGYPDLAGSTHPDFIKNPNKHAPRREGLFQKALEQVGEVSSERIIRIALDDDDWWMPWQVTDIVRFAEQAYEPGKVVAVGNAEDYSRLPRTGTSGSRSYQANHDGK